MSPTQAWARSNNVTLWTVALQLPLTCSYYEGKCGAVLTAYLVEKSIPPRESVGALWGVPQQGIDTIWQVSTSFSQILSLQTSFTVERNTRWKARLNEKKAEDFSSASFQACTLPQVLCQLNIY